MAAILITGMSGTGKSTALRKLAARGHPVIDTDDPGWCRLDGDDWVWDEERMTRLLDDHERAGGTVFVQGTVSNQGHFYARFDEVVLLTAPLGVMLERIAARDDNPYGKSDAERAEIERNLEAVQPLLQSGASVELDATAPVDEIADTLERLIRT